MMCESPCAQSACEGETVIQNDFFHTKCLIFEMLNCWAINLVWREVVLYWRLCDNEINYHVFEVSFFQGGRAIKCKAVKKKKTLRCLCFSVQVSDKQPNHFFSDFVKWTVLT